MCEQVLVQLGDSVRLPYEDGSFDGYGTYEIDGNRIALTRDDGVDGGDGSVRSGQVTIQMTMVDEGVVMPYVFRK